ncbi:diacylglycerol/lipid kinase family protein [Micromonospora sp. CA-240977]|uniref:diacylglycerol/lipid kinase family protein n=1 Tax=Micromonospora sp. CA-240977 TaxID=3239957 RepID=UPI003D89D34E
MPPRCLLIVNPRATRMNPGARDELTGILGGLRLDVVDTARRGHATELARTARREGYDVVLTASGDGAANETVNGLLADGVADDVPVFAPLPAGGTNVFARSIGLPNQLGEAARLVRDAVTAGGQRRLGLGLVGDRWFAFVCSLGLDAEIVREAEQLRFGVGVRPPRMPAAAYLTLLVRQHLRTDRRHPALTFDGAGGAHGEAIFMAFVCNSAPWTYLGKRAVAPAPTASFDRGLDVLGLTSLGTLATMRVVRQMMTAQAPLSGPDVVTAEDQQRLTMLSIRPIAVQVDGDFLGMRTEATFQSVPAALPVPLLTGR